MYSQVPKDKPVVQKYGGTSVGSPERIKAVAKRVAAHANDGWNKLAIVVSAMSGETNRLVDLVRQVNPDASAKSYDMAVAAGEQVSVGLVCAALEAEGIAAEPFLAYQVGIFTDEFHSRARLRNIRSDKIQECWEKGRIPVIAGFQGVTSDLAITTLGRGGSDTSAVALAVALDAAFCEINTDVDGVYTADPRHVPEAKLIEVLDYEVALEMASLGSKVLHSRCVELGAKFRMPIVVRNSFQPDDSKRTRIMSFSHESNPGATLEAPAVSGITLDKDVAKVTLSGLKADSSVIAEVFERVAARGINVDIIVHDRSERVPTGTMRIGFTVSGGDLPEAMRAISQLKEEKGYHDLDITADAECAKVSAVGVGMRSHAGVASRLFTGLTAAGVAIQMISTSEIKISCVVAVQDGLKASKVLHDLFFSEH